ncbi:hypothetical protein PPYR_07492 [Photinus pyralis]|uniref:PBZ-type domain-containing protein n=1 Tax=Photinus pyralis TaxID=7054 RepID=A0A5N4AQH7_PHOPY|nr:histone PARylation factor 1-like [Photinus pyralis]KAB0799612.1 hypothetical protein PPYR_07492 [Photinus pyralis]
MKMVTPDEEYDHYVKDPRTPCKFGISCYQKNAAHKEKYKHPPKKRPAEEAASEVENKKAKNESENGSSHSPPAPIAESEEPTATTSSTVYPKEFIKEKFLVEMPDDFYMLWEYCQTLNKANPSKAFSEIGLELVGPYDVLSQKLLNINKPTDDYLIHWRYYHDPPEFQTVLKGNDSTEYHIGYFRDDPNDLPVFLAANHAKKDGVLTCVGGNIFAAVWHMMEAFKKICDPFKKLSVTNLQGKIKKQAENLKLSLDLKPSHVKERNTKIVSSTFNSIGLVVPYNRKTQVGYRHLCVGAAELRKLLDRVGKASPQQKEKVMSELQPVLTATSIATDECDFGTGIELGWNILAHGVDSLNSTIARFLATNYELIGRDAFAVIIRAHMKNRKRGVDLSIC